MAKKWNKPLVLIVKLLVSGSLMYWVLERAGIGKVVEQLREISPLAFLAAVALYVLSQFVSTLRWQTLLSERFTVPTLFSLYLLGSFFNTFLPGLVGGDAVKAWYLYKKNVKGTSSLASVFMDRYMGYTALMLIGIISYPFGLGYIRGTFATWLLPLIVGVYFLVSLAFFGLRLGGRFRFIGEIYTYFHSYRDRKEKLLRALLLSFCVQGLSMGMVYVLALGMGLRLDPLAFVVLMPIIITLAAVPLSISGIGIREMAFVLLLGVIGVEKDMATALSFSWFLSIAAGGLFGLVEYLRHSDYRAARREMAPAEEK